MTTTATPPSSQLAVPSRPDPRNVVLGLTMPEQAETIAELLGAVGDVESLIRTATAWRTGLLEAARRAVELAPEAMLAPELAPDTWRADDAADLARRALVAEVATTLTVHERTATRLLDEAEVLVGGLPATAAAMRAGRVSYRHAQALVEHTADLDPVDRARVEAAVLPAAASVPPGAFARQVARTRERLLAEPVTVRHERAACRRSVRVDPARDGMAFLTAYLPAATACAVADRLDRAVGVLRGPDEPRTTDQLRADVLSALLLDDGTLDHTALAAPAGPDGPDGDAATDPGDEPSARELVERLWAVPFDPDDAPNRVDAARAAMARLARGITPHVTVTVPALTLLRTLTPDTHDGSGPPPGQSPPGDASPPGQSPPGDASPPGTDPAAGTTATTTRGPTDVAYLDGYGPIDDHTATILAAHAPSFRRLLTHPHTGAVLALGRDTYAVPADLRAFLRLRDQTCRFPGCSRPAARCDVDHTIAYVSGGTTDATNLAHLCRTHHRLKHATRWDVHQTSTDGTLTWTSTTGREIVTRPAIEFDDDPPPF